MLLPNSVTLGPRECRCSVKVLRAHVLIPGCSSADKLAPGRTQWEDSRTAPGIPLAPSPWPFQCLEAHSLSWTTEQTRVALPSFRLEFISNHNENILAFLRSRNLHLLSLRLALIQRLNKTHAWKIKLAAGRCHSRCQLKCHIQSIRSAFQAMMKRNSWGKVH